MSFEPLFDPMLLWLCLGLGALLCMSGIWLRQAGSVWRGLAVLVLVLAAFQPVYVMQNTNDLPDIVLVMSDESASQSLGNRSAQSAYYLEQLEQQIADMPNTVMQHVSWQGREVTDYDEGGSFLMGQLEAAIMKVPTERLSAVILVTDGLVHDQDMSLDLDVPVHVVLTGSAQDWDRRIVLKEAPLYGILGQDEQIKLRVDHVGQGAPAQKTVPLIVRIGALEPQRFEVPLGVDIDLPFTLPHAGENLFSFESPVHEGELTGRNNYAVHKVNAIRDRLRVLLVSGAPHAGGRIWRNLLKSDPSVDLVHFTILRSLDKENSVPDDELSLIPFPQQELFDEKLASFDLIIFDRFSRRGILNTQYFANMRDYVREGGAILVSAGPEYAAVESLYRSPLGEVLPGVPTVQVKAKAFRPEVSELGTRHPVTSQLSEDDTWGSWLRVVEVEPSGNEHVVMQTPDGLPLLMLQHTDEGRVALLTSDQSWLWARGFEGGGPYSALLKRVAHWLMKEPELEADVLFMHSVEGGIEVVRRSLQEQLDPLVTVRFPDGRAQTAALEPKGLDWSVRIETDEAGLYQVEHRDLTAVFALGAQTALEFQEVVSSSAPLMPLVEAHKGGIVQPGAQPDSSEFALSLRKVNDKEAAFGGPNNATTWLGLVKRGATEVLSRQHVAVFPDWLAAVLCGICLVAAWVARRRFML